MSTQDRISRLAQQLGERLQGASHAPEEFQRGVQQVVRGAFDRLELVSREDFDILMDVLQRTRSRVEALEKQVAALESALDKREGHSHKPAIATSGNSIGNATPQDKSRMGSKEDAASSKAKRAMAEEETTDAKQGTADNKTSDTAKSKRPDA
ncbi:accessory factor UbiK family protein [Pistricoccus aurantiacus]|uniref:Ubiquinone biosynthesis accessory factor UbiK n=1 Tax=Pistricoccus aurantiacus TaxID=1883414 RepID=A0A5B8SQA3_9GAMM|nr:accessory factor UbiK family protein [Pistricoccus aurantiacus]